MRRVFRKAKVLWGRVEATVLLIGIPAALLVWAYSNFATAAQMKDTQDTLAASKAELRAYVDQRHGEVASQLQDLKAELQQQRQLQEKILLRVSN